MNALSLDQQNSVFKYAPETATFLSREEKISLLQSICLEIEVKCPSDNFDSYDDDSLNKWLLCMGKKKVR